LSKCIITLANPCLPLVSLPNTGTDATRAVSPDGLADWTGSTNITTAGALSATSLTTTGAIELGHASDTTLARVSAGIVSIEGSKIMTVGSTDTITGVKSFSGGFLVNDNSTITPTNTESTTSTIQAFRAVSPASTTAGLQFLGATESRYALLSNPGNVTLPANNNYIGFAFGNSNVVTAGASGTHNLISRIAIKGLTIDSGAATTANAATFYIEGAATGTETITNNYALWVDGGISRLDGGLLLDNLTASELIATDANKNLVSLAVATYPSLTELSYIKGLTSAIQTQLGGKANTALSNLASVAINTSLISDTDSTDDLGSSAKYWANTYTDRVYLNSTAYLYGTTTAGEVNFSGSKFIVDNGRIEIYSDQANALFFAYAYGGNRFPSFSGRQAYGTKAEPTATIANKTIFRMGGAGYGTTGFPGTNNAQIDFKTSENWTDAAQGTYISFSTTPTGTITTSEIVRMTDVGNVKLAGTAVRATTEGTNQTARYPSFFSINFT